MKYFREKKTAEFLRNCFKFTWILIFNYDIVFAIFCNFYFLIVSIILRRVVEP